MPETGVHRVADGSDETLAKAAAGGCRRSFASLLERHYDRIYRLAWRKVGSRAEAEDIAQDVCVKLATAIGTFRGEAAFSTWLYRIAFTTATDRLRDRQRIIAFAPSDMSELADSLTSDTPETAAIGAEECTGGATGIGSCCRVYSANAGPASFPRSSVLR